MAALLVFAAALPFVEGRAPTVDALPVGGEVFLGAPWVPHALAAVALAALSARFVVALVIFRARTTPLDLEQNIFVVGILQRTRFCGRGGGVFEGIFL